MTTLIVFSTAQTAQRAVLAVPALARALRAVSEAGETACYVHIPGLYAPPPALQHEIARLAPGLAVTYRQDLPDDAWPIVPGEALLDARALAARLNAETSASDNTSPARLDECILTPSVACDLLQRRSRELLAATGKPGDGIVSRHINRPISQRISGFLLDRFGQIAPVYATAVTALISFAMAAALIFIHGQAGLLIGALLFQAASIFDGVDGEIARATFRTSDRGGSIDSLVDAATNFLFFGGVVANLHLQSDSRTAGLALAGMCGLILGTLLLGLRAERKRGIVDFETVKQELAGRKSKLMQWLTWLTMRDFYAFAAAVLIALGLVVPAVWAFDVVVTGWLVVVMVMLALRR